MSLTLARVIKILIINSEYPPIGGGAGNASANIARGLASLGYEVSVLTAHFAGQPRLEICDGVTIHRIPSLRRRLDRSGPLEQLVFILSASFWTLFQAWRKRPDATLAFFGMPSGAISWLLKKLHRIPYIISLRGGDVPGFRPYDFKKLHKWIAPFLRIIWHSASAVVANSNGLRDLALAFDSSIEIPIIPNGVDGSFYTDESRAWSPVRILSVGRVVHQKGLNLGLRALAKLTDLDWEWHIAGDGSEIELLKTLARELGISERVKFLGWQSREELSKCYHQANLFLFPSRHEGMPNAVLEAMSSGLPVVATRIAGNEELVVDGVTGWLVNTEDVDSLREGLRRLIVEEKMRMQMGQAARQRVEKEYSWENTARQYSHILENINK
ncbi:MAG: glycosyltransferase family 4 protein [Chloroflexi bacterium]|nr:glycosyltransferase family 4 protein [Chloroflexota bacterium]